MKPLTIILVVMVGTGVLTGCATAPIDLYRTGHVQVAQTAEGTVRISGLGVHEKDGGIEVCGTLKRVDRSAVAIKAHVDITVRTSEGVILAQTISKSQYVTRRGVGTGSAIRKRFSVFLELIPPKDSVVQVVVHSQEHDPEKP